MNCTKEVRTIDLATSAVVSTVQSTGFLAPLFFIFMHILRQFLFIPVVVICIIGGILFGTQFGTFYSIIGLTVASISFYTLSKQFPSFLERFSGLKKKWLGNYTRLSVGQIIVLRMIPFVNFSILSLCILDRSTSFKDYAKLSFWTHIPAAFCFTSFGAYFGKFSLVTTIVLIGTLILFVYLLREKRVIIKWHDFFAKTMQKP
ncbi:VTT domain-containing protein [Bacillus sp. F19]|nr:VTT domain-containing protein [Bacillus sp. F19]